MSSDRADLAQDRGGSRASSPDVASPELRGSIVEKKHMSPEASDESDAEVEALPNTNPTTVTKVPSDIKSEEDSEPEPEPEHEIQAHTKTEPIEELPHATEPELPIVEVAAERDTESSSEFESEPESERGQDPKPASTSSPELDSEAESDSEQEPEPETTAKTSEEQVVTTEPSESPAEQEQEAESVEESEVETPKMTHDSMVTVRLSEPPTLKLDTAFEEDKRMSTHTKTTSMASDAGTFSDDSNMPRTSTVILPHTDSSRSLQDELGECDEDDHQSDGSEDQEEVNWEELEKTEDEQIRDDEADNSTALLLARLEQENAKLATNPKTAMVQAVDKLSSPQRRPPSRAQLQQMVSEPTPSALRYSMLPPPPMTDLEFYAALVKDYQQTAARLPTLLTNKIRKGIPPPLRGVVWQSMSGARDADLEDQYDRFSGESSPYELLIGKDLGRSFPGVDMFRDADGEGQQMLGRVLKCFSLYDTKIGYCQGLAFLVGPLLMHMPDKQAFCVLVRLMERYDLRACFLPDLSGLHVRIYQFRELLRHNLPALANHLEELQVETAYVSQWFLSFFAVTCPLPMLFRIYDVLFAEGASETLMRVALSLMRKNESRLMACTELEDVMQLLLSRGLWDCYHYDADEFVSDFASLSGEVTREKLAQLEQAYRESLIATANAARASDVTTGATRFLGRIWASSTNTSPKTATLTPGLGAPGKSVSVLKRSTSKQSLASTLNSMEASSASIASSTSTDGTSVSRNSEMNGDEESCSRESTPVGPKSASSAKAADDRYLHSQIEDLLTALSELQRNQALLSSQLQREREEREEDRRTVCSLLDGLRKKAGNTDSGIASSPDSLPGDDTEDEATQVEIETAGSKQKEDAVDDDVLDEATPLSDATEKPISMADGLHRLSLDPPSTEDLSELLDRVEARFAHRGDEMHRASMIQTKSQLREELTQAKAESTSLAAQCQDLNRRIYDMDQEMTSIKDQLKDRHGHVRTLHQDKQRLEKQIQTMKSRASSIDTASREAEQELANAKGSVAGLREFKLGRSQSTPSAQNRFSKRISSLPIPNEMGGESPASEHEALLLELVQAKTAEATAKQEAEEAKQKLEALRKSYGLAPSDQPATAAGAAASAMGGVFGRLTGQTVPPTQTPNENSPKLTTSASTNAVPAVGSFWGWRR